MPNIDEDAKAWQLELAGRAGAAMKSRRKELGLTALGLAQRTESLGYPVSRVAISKIESNARSGKLDMAELIVLARALEITPLLLLYPELPHGRTRFVPALPEMYMHLAALSFAGEIEPFYVDPEIMDQIDPFPAKTLQPLALSKALVESLRTIGWIDREIRSAKEDGDSRALGILNERLESEWKRRNQIWTEMVEAGMKIAPPLVETLDEYRDGESDA